MIVGLVYAIPIFVLYVITYGSIVLAVLSGGTGPMESAMLSEWTPNIGLVLLMYLVEIGLGLILPVASIRFARTNSLFRSLRYWRNFWIHWKDRVDQLHYCTHSYHISDRHSDRYPCPWFYPAGGDHSVHVQSQSHSNRRLYSCNGHHNPDTCAFFCRFARRYMTRVYDSAEPEE